MGGKERLPRPQIFIDGGETRCDIPKFLRAFIQTKAGDGVDIFDKKDSPQFKHDRCGDYIITDRAGQTWGVERKSFLDCYDSIMKGKFDGQLSELMAKFPGHAVLMVEEFNGVPRTLQSKKWKIISIVNSAMSSKSLLLPTWHFNTQNDCAKYMVKFAKEAHRMKIGGRGVTVTLNGSDKYEYEVGEYFQ